MSNNGNGIQHLKERDFERVVLESETPTVVDFYADWCGPCRTVGPVIESLSQEYAGKANFAKVNTDENEGLSARYDVMSIPTVLIFKKGNIVGKVVGVAPPQVYRERINAALAGN